MAKVASNKTTAIFSILLGLILKKKLVKYYIFGAYVFMVLKLGHLGKQIRNTWEVLKCGAGDECRTSFGLIMCEIKKYYIESMRTGLSYI
jgi:hypothetical protein